MHTHDPGHANSFLRSRVVHRITSLQTTLVHSNVRQLTKLPRLQCKNTPQTNFPDVWGREPVEIWGKPANANNNAAGKRLV